MRCHADVSAIIAVKHIIEDFLAADILVFAHFCQERLPKFIGLSESGFDLVAWEGGFNVRLGAAAIAG